jgi:hypothetical protein
MSGAGVTLPVMDVEQDCEPVVASLAARLSELTFAGLTTDEVTARLIDEIARWGTEQGWRVYRRAPSVVPLPPPMTNRFSVLDIACARPDGPPVVIEIDRTDRGRTVDKLLAEAAAGRIAVWVRWGTGGFAAPPLPIRMVTCEVTRGAGRSFSRGPVTERPAPAHSTGIAGAGATETVPLL